MHRSSHLAVAAAIGSCVLAFAALASARPGAADGRILSKVLRWDEAASSRDRWGEMRKYFTGEGHGVKDLFTAVAVIKPGEALHKAHRHAEEEFLFIAEGSGTWHLNGKDLPLRKGDILYVEPWIAHGFTNTGSEPVTFFVIKWNGKGVPVPQEPASGR